MKRLAVGLWILFVALVAGHFVLEVINGHLDQYLASFAFTAGFATFATLGALICIRRPGNALGWIFLAGALGVVIANVAATLSDVVRTAAGSWTPIAIWGRWISSVVWTASVESLVTFAVLLFPEGRPPSRLGRVLTWVAAVTIVVLTAGRAMAPGPLDHIRGNPDNPAGVRGADVLLGAFFFFLILTIAAGLVSIFMRFRRASGEKRQQFKWFFLGGAIFLVLLAASFTAESVIPEVLGDAMLGVAVAALPGTMALAILRYRLYDIDRIVSRTVSYGVVTGVLAGTFTLIVLVPTSLIGSTRTPSWLVTIATLLVAFLFQPLRRRVQTRVDHRFNRTRYDASRTIDEFASRLREDIELESLVDELKQLVHRTMQPERVGIWLRERR